jgi:Dolichyl-phosphate-mannose-protein mannosyltransferase
VKHRALEPAPSAVSIVGPPQPDSATTPDAATVAIAVSAPRPGGTVAAVRLHPAATMVGILLALIALIQFGWSVGVVLHPGQVDNAEAVVHDQAARLVRGEPLYQPLDRPPYTVAAYTPLYYWLAGGLQAPFGPGFAPGRALSFLAGLVAAGLVAHLAARRAGDRRAGAFAAALFLALGLPAYYLWSALYRVDLVGVALALGAIAVLIGGTSPRRLILAGMLAGLAILTKQTLFAAALAGAVWLWRRDRKKVAVFAGVGLVVTLLASLTLEMATGAYLTNTVVANVNPFSLDLLVANLAILALFQAGPLAVAARYLAARQRLGHRVQGDLLALYGFASLLPLIGLAKVGSSQNYWIETAAVTAVLATAGLWSRSCQQASVPVRLLGVSLAAAVAMLGGLALPVTVGLWSSHDGTGQLSELIARVRSEPGEVLADPADVVTLSGRRNLFEPYIFSILHYQGQWDARPFARRICAGEVGLLVLSYQLDGPGPRYYGDAPHWPPPILAALRETMILEAEQAGRFIYVPRLVPPGEACQPQAP